MSYVAFFFVKQKTAYEMRISDWSSDVCSSDLGVATCAGSTCHGRNEGDGKVVRQDELRLWQEPSSKSGAHSRTYAALAGARSEARRVGKECVRTFRSRWSPVHSKTQANPHITVSTKRGTKDLTMYTGHE